MAADTEQVAGRKESELFTPGPMQRIMGHSYQKAILEFNSMAIHILHNPMFFSDSSSETHLKVINYKAFQNHIFSV
jgi:hypothetical protein